ncbi:hypothetical protein CB021_013860, partial [Salmonella enterica]|nr:hypothetical protein [Salmonella enterica]
YVFLFCCPSNSTMQAKPSPHRVAPLPTELSGSVGTNSTEVFVGVLHDIFILFDNTGVLSILDLDISPYEKFKLVVFTQHFGVIVASIIQFVDICGVLCKFELAHDTAAFIEALSFVAAT